MTVDHTLRLEWIDPETLSDNPKNWRRHPRGQRKAFEQILDDVGWAGVLLYNERTGRLIDGHLRKDVAVRRKEKAVPVLVGNWDEEKERRILLSLDPLTEMAQRDTEILSALIAQVGEEEGADWLDALWPAPDESEGKYTWSVKTPIYEPRGERPTVDMLYDDTKARELLVGIERADGLSEEEKEFLRLAAYRHVTFHFQNIAEYYAHASPEVRRLFEESALVIVDFQAALERGWIRLVGKLRELVREEYGE